MRSIRALMGGTFSLLLVFAIAAPAAAHADIDLGAYRLAVGWATEPTYVGLLNSVQVLVFDASGNPVTDLAPGDLSVTVGAAGQQSDPVALSAAFDTEEGFGTPGDYEGSLIPTVSGDYTFHVTGNIHGQAVDQTVTSGETTFDSPVEPSAVEFPAKLPSTGELATRIDRVESRAAADSSQALLVGGVLGAAGVLIGVVALWMAMRRRRTAGA